MNASRMVRAWGLSLLTVAIFGVMATVGRSQTAVGKSSGSGKVVLYAAVGPELTQYDVDVDAATLTKRGSVTLPQSVTEAAFAPSRKFLYVSWGYTLDKPVDGKHPHGISAFRIDPASGALLPHGQPASLPASPGYLSYITTDIPGTHLLVSDTDPSHLAAYRIAADGTVGSEVKPAPGLDFGSHAHQVRVDPSNKAVILVTRGNGPTATTPEDPGALKIFHYKDGILTSALSIAPGGGFNFQPRHVDFHPSMPLDFITLERQNKLLVYQRLGDGTLNPTPLFTKNPLADPGNVKHGQILGTVHFHPNGKFLYVANRASDTTDFQGKPVFAGGENNIGVFSIDPKTGEPTLIQNVDTRGIHPRTFAIDRSGKLLVAANIIKLSVRDGEGVRPVPACLTVFRIGGDGKIEFVRKYDIELGSNQQLLWVGMTSLP